MDNNKRPESMERITTPALAQAFIAEQVEGHLSPSRWKPSGNRLVTKRFCWLFPAVWTALLSPRC